MTWPSRNIYYIGTTLEYNDIVWKINIYCDVSDCVYYHCSKLASTFYNCPISHSETILALPLCNPVSFKGRELTLRFQTDKTFPYLYLSQSYSQAH
jgi:hypothetical protein